jgi:2-polyprenyl-3-methyl-5-hydroxy-6-metoxy-1,4-benzoquinol methylase
VNSRLFRHRLLIIRRIVASKINRLIGPLNIYIQPEKLYDIKAGYRHAHHIETFDDRLNTDQWQRGVYELAQSQFNEMKGKSVIDVGCGSAYKLMEMFGNHDTIGIELTDTCHWLSGKYPGRKWVDFEGADPSDMNADIVICSDVIEHVKNPDQLMEFLKEIRFRQLVISTPERNIVRGKWDFGPPENTTHYREWNGEEFKNFISKWFNVKEQIISRDKSASQILICTTN